MHTEDDLRQDQHGDARLRAAVLDVTMSVLAETGYQRLRVEAVAARAGVRRVWLRRWWATRPLLVAEALQGRAAAAVTTPTGDLVADVRGVVARTAAFLDDPVIADALVGLAGDAAGDAVAAQRFAALLAPRRAAETSILLSAVARGDLPPDTNVPLLLDVVFSTLLFRRTVGTPADEATREALVQLIAAARPDRAASADYAETDERTDDGRPAEDDRADGQPVNGHVNGQVDGHRIDGHRIDGHRIDGHRIDGHRIDDDRIDGHRVADSSLLFTTQQWTDIPSPRRPQDGT